MWPFFSSIKKPKIPDWKPPHGYLTQKDIKQCPRCNGVLVQVWFFKDMYQQYPLTENQFICKWVHLVQTNSNGGETWQGIRYFEQCLPLKL